MQTPNNKHTHDHIRVGKQNKQMMINSATIIDITKHLGSLPSI